MFAAESLMVESMVVVFIFAQNICGSMNLSTENVIKFAGDATITKNLISQNLNIKNGFTLK